MLFRAAFLFIELNALLASTSKIPSVAGSSAGSSVAGSSYIHIFWIGIVYCTAFTEKKEDLIYFSFIIIFCGKRGGGT